MKRALFCLFFICLSSFVFSNSFLTKFRPTSDAKRTTYIDLDGDRDPDVLRTYLNGDVPVQWIDDDDDMKVGDLQGDSDNDCLMIDRNKDGNYGDEFDLMIDWVDTNNDGKADMQLLADNAKRTDRGWTPGHFMISLDADSDGMMNYVDWNTLKIEAWDRIGQCDFFQDYSGKTILFKTHTSTFNMDDLRYNWENPFLFYETDQDGFSEMAIRLMDVPQIDLSKIHPVKLSKRITDVRMTFDLDNDNAPGNEFDFDMSLKLTGKGFDYSKCVHKFKNLRGLPASDQYFYDPRWRQLDELIYVDHESAYRKVFDEGEWSQCGFVFDEDDDCQRWERVEFYDSKDLFKIGARNGGLDNNPQADATGDRGEWDMDFSGKGNLYIGGFDGMIHLLGAEWGAWRIDQNAKYYQGWQGWRNGADSIPHALCNAEPSRFPTVNYIDSNNNGFIDVMQYDMDGDSIFEKVFSLLELGIDDRCEVWETSKMNYSDYQSFYKQAASKLWNKALSALKVAQKQKIETSYFCFLLSPKSIQQKYHNGFWLNYYVYEALKEKYSDGSNQEMKRTIDRAYISGNWELIK